MASISRFTLFWKTFLAALLGSGASYAAGPEEISAWNTAVSANTADGYYLYLSLYPAGDYVDEAVAALVQISTGAPRQIVKVPPSTPAKPTTTGGLY